jgi:hypothetical protein
LDIDYSNIKQNDVVLDEEWEAPVHRFFGKKLPNGKTEKEPVYVHKDFPAMMYAKVDGKITAKLINSQAELSALGKEWSDTPATFGVVGAPSFDEAMKRKAA